MSSTERTQTERLLVSMLRELTRRDLRDDIAIDRAPDELDGVQHATERELALLTIERHSVWPVQTIKNIAVPIKALRGPDWLAIPMCG